MEWNEMDDIPSVSTLGSLRTITLRTAMRRVPSERQSVITCRPRETAHFVDAGDIAHTLLLNGHWTGVGKNKTTQRRRRHRRRRRRRRNAKRSAQRRTTGSPFRKGVGKKKKQQQEEEEDKKTYRGQPLRDRRDAERDRDLEVVDRALGPLALEHGRRELGRWCRSRAGERAGRQTAVKEGASYWGHTE